MPLPSPKSGEDQNSFMSRCISFARKENPNASSEEVTAICFSQWRKSKENWHLLEFSAPIKETIVDDDFMINGTAINETTTHNGHKYIAEELEKAAPSLNGKPLLLDHDNSVKSIAGRVIDSKFNPQTKSIEFNGRVNNTPQGKSVQELIKEGDLKTVSIGAFARDLVKEKDGIVAKGIEIVELSFTPVPADQGANFAMALSKNYQLKESLIKDERRLTEMAEEKETTEEENGSEESESEDNSDSEAQEKLKELNSQNKNLISELNALKQEKKNNLIESYKSLCTEKGITARETEKLSEETLNVLIEQLKEIKYEKKEFKSQVTEKKSNFPDELKDFVVESNGFGGLSLWKMPDIKRWSELHADMPFLENGR